MIKLSIYDFDETLYKYDTGRQLIFFLFRRKPSIIKYLPRMIWAWIAYRLGHFSFQVMKSEFYSFMELFTVEEWKKLIQIFWQINQKYLFSDVLMQLQYDKNTGFKVGIISASAEYFLMPIIQYIQPDFFLGTRLYIKNDRMTGVIVGKNCKEQEKVTRLYEYMDRNFPGQEYEVIKMYSDSLYDLPLYKIAQEQYTVNSDGKIRPGIPTVYNN